MMEVHGHRRLEEHVRESVTDPTRDVDPPASNPTGARLRCRPRALLLALLLVPSVASAQTVIEGTTELGFDEPESWAMKWFASLTVPSGLGEPRELGAGEIDLGFEAAWVPYLSEEERRVGFVGTKVEDLNRSSVFGRLRATFGLPAGLRLTAAWVPPAEVDGVTPHLFAVALGRDLLRDDRWSLGARLMGQTGSFRGDLTCSAAAVEAGPDPGANPFNCLEPSDDEMELTLGGLEVTATLRPGGRWQPYLAAAGQWLDLEFQVDARYAPFLEIVDRTRLTTDGWTWTVATGLSYRLSPRVALSGELFYAPLTVERSPGRTQNDELITARGMISYRVR